MCRSAAKTLMSSLESLQSIHFKTNTLPDNLITLMSKLNLTGNPPNKPLELKVEFSHNRLKEILHETIQTQ